MNLRKRNPGWFSTLFLFAIAMLALPQFTAAQNNDNYDQQDDPPDRVARLGYLQGSVSFQPAGESEWVEAVSNRPITTGDRLWSDQNSRAEVELGSSVIRLSSNTGFSFLNLDDRTVQIQLTAGSINVRVRRLDSGDLFEIDTPNQAFSVFRPGNYRVEASEDGNYTVVSVRDGEGESTGNGQNYTVHAGQQATFSGTDSLNAEVVDIGGRDQFDDWSNTRDRRYDDSRSAQYVSHDVVGYEDLDDYGDWRDDSNYGHVWYPTRVSSGWAPYQEGHWDWIPPWGWTWVDDSPWGYAPFHYGRWVTIGGRWGWIAGPIAVRPVYAPALVVFIGGGGGFGGNVGWFPLGPREVYVPSYRVSRGYVNRVNVSNTNVNVTNITNVYNTTIINKTTNITNVTYVNRNVRGAVTAVPQRTFTGAQSVGRARVNVNERDIASAQMTARVAVAPTRESVLGVRANTANRVNAPPAAIANRQVIAKAAPPAPPVPFARQQRALEQNPGQPLARREVQNLRPANAPDAHPMVKIAPPGKAATLQPGRPGNRPNQAGDQPRDARQNQPGTSPTANRPGNDRTPNQRPNVSNPEPPTKNDQPANQRDNRPDVNRPNNRPDANRPEPPVKNDQPPADWRNNRPNGNRPNNPPDVKTTEPPAKAEPPVKNDQPPQDWRNNRPTGNQPNNRPGVNQQGDAPAREDRSPANQRDNRPDPNRPNNRPTATPAPEAPSGNDRPSSRPDQRPDNRPDANRQPNTQPNDRPRPTPPAERTASPDRPVQRPADTQPAPERPKPQPRAQTSEEKKAEQERQKHEHDKPPNQ